MLSSVVDAAAALALAEFRGGCGQTRHRVDTFNGLRRHARPCAERREAGVGGSDHGSARYRPAHTGRDAECQGGRFRFDRMSEAVLIAMLVPHPKPLGRTDYGGFESLVKA